MCLRRTIQETFQMLTDIASMTVADLKQMLKTRGITTRLRSVKKLQELLLNTLKDH